MRNMLPHSAVTHCNTEQHAATLCCNALQQPRKRNALQRIATCCHTLLQCTATIKEDRVVLTLCRVVKQDVQGMCSRREDIPYLREHIPSTPSAHVPRGRCTGLEKTHPLHFLRAHIPYSTTSSTSRSPGLGTCSRGGLHIFCRGCVLYEHREETCSTHPLHIFFWALYIFRGQRGDIRALYIFRGQRGDILRGQRGDMLYTPSVYPLRGKCTGLERIHLLPRVEWRGLIIWGGNLSPQNGVFCIFRFQSIWVGLSEIIWVPEYFGEITKWLKWMNLRNTHAWLCLANAVSPLHSTCGTSYEDRSPTAQLPRGRCAGLAKRMWLLWHVCWGGCVGVVSW